MRTSAARRASAAPLLLDEAGLAGTRPSLVGDLSGGMRQRLGFALALLTDPAHPRARRAELRASTPPAAQWLAERLRAFAAAGPRRPGVHARGQELLSAGHRRIVLEDGASSRRSPGRGRDARSTDVRPTCAGGARARRIRRPVVRKELRDAIGNRWLIGYAAVLGALGLAATATGLDSTSGLALQAFGRTTATLMNLCLLLAPLVAVLMGAASIAGERDRGTLEHLLAQPLSRTGLLLAKHAGLLLALTLATLAGFLPAGVLLVARRGAGMLGHYLLFPAIASLAGAAMAGVGLLISVSSRSAVQAQGTGVFAWFGFVLLYDLVLIGALSVSGMPPSGWRRALVANPVDAARVLGVLALEPDLYLLGPAGAYLRAPLPLRRGAAARSRRWSSGRPAAVATMKFALPHPAAARRRAAARDARESHSRPLTRGRQATVTTEEVTLS